MSGDALLRRALQEAEVHEKGLTQLYRNLREAGHAYAYGSAHDAAAAVDDLIRQLREDLGLGPDDDPSVVRVTLDNRTGVFTPTDPLTASA